MAAEPHLQPEGLANVVKRLRRIEGQVRGIQRMCEQGRPCGEVLTQMNATVKALESAAATVLREYLEVVATDIAQGRVRDPNEISELLRKFA